MERRVFWSQEALQNLHDTIFYLETEWSKNEAYAFRSKLFKLISVIHKFPFIFPSSKQKPHLRRALLSKQTSIIYLVTEEEILILNLQNNYSGNEL